MTDGKQVATILCNAYDSSVRKLLGIHLEKMGYRSILVSSVNEAISKVPNADLVLTDVTSGGKRLYDHVRANRPDIKAIFMDGSGHYAEGAPEGSAVIQKPFTFAQLEAIVNGNVSEHLKPANTQ